MVFETSGNLSGRVVEPGLRLENLPDERLGDAGIRQKIKLRLLAKKSKIKVELNNQPRKLMR